MPLLRAASFLIFLVAAAPQLAAQESDIPRRAPPILESFAAVEMRASNARSGVHDAPLRERSTRPSLTRVVAGTLGGGVLGAAALGASGAILGSGAEGEGFISPSAALAVLGAAIGYPVGAAVGARWGATAENRAPSLGRIMTASVLGTVVGAVVWNRIGETFEPAPISEPDRTAWYAGAAAGLTLHLSITSLAAYRAGSRAATREP